MEQFLKHIYSKDQIKSINHLTDISSGNSIFTFNNNLKNGQLFLDKDEIKLFEKSNK